MRKKKVIKGHLIKPDKKFASRLVSQLINKVMKNGEKRKAAGIVYQAAQVIEKDTALPFLTILEGALVNVKPVIEMKSRKIGGSKHRVPKEIDEVRSVKIALRWLVEGAQGKKITNPMYEKLAQEVTGAYNKSGEAIKKKENLYKEAESGRVFSFTLKH